MLRITIFLLCVSITAGLSSLAQSSTDRIHFYAEDPQTAPGKSQPLQELRLTNKTNLFIKVSLQQPLTYFLQQLLPGVDADSLSKIGNYQFNFFVDDRLVYHTELIPGAPRPIQQQKDTSWIKPIIDNQHEGAWWSQSAWNRFMFNGGDSALTDGQHVLKIVFRPYVKTPALKIGEPLAQGTIRLTVQRVPKIELAKVKIAPIKPYADLETSKDPYDRDLIKKLKAYVDADVFKHITSIVVLKNEKILIEEYFNGSSRDSIHDVRSVGKSFASTLTGMAIQDGFLKSVHQPLKDFYALKDYQNYSAAKENVTIKELLTMSSRFNGNDDDAASPGNEENMYPQPDWVKFALDLPLDTVKYHGDWHYFTTGVMLAGSTLDKLIPGGLEKYADEKLFKVLNIRKYQWPYTPQHVPSTAGGIRMSALDFAKYGQLYANGGKWKGKQVLQKTWVDETLSKQLPITGRPDEYYGYLFWNKAYQVKNKWYETFYASGNGGNKIFIFKDQPLVIVITSTAYGTAYAHRQADRIVAEFLLPSIVYGR